MAPLALFNEGAPGHFFHLIKTPKMRLQSVKILLCWPSRMHIYGFVENHTFFNMMEQFVSMGYQDIFQSIGTIEWQATERSEGAPKAIERSEGAQGSDGDLVREIGYRP